MIPQVLRKRDNITNKLLSSALKEITPLTDVLVISSKKRKLEMEEKDLKKRKMEYLEKTTSLNEEYKHLLETEQRLNESKEIVIKGFRNIWINLNIHGS